MNTDSRYAGTRCPSSFSIDLRHLSELQRRLIHTYEDVSETLFNLDWRRWPYTYYRTWTVQESHGVLRGDEEGTRLNVRTYGENIAEWVRKCDGIDGEAEDGFDMGLYLEKIGVGAEVIRWGAEGFRPAPGGPARIAAPAPPSNRRLPLRDELHAAAQDGDLNRVSRLLANGFAPSRRDGAYLIAYERAAAAGHASIMDRLRPPAHVAELTAGHLQSLPHYIEKWTSLALSNRSGDIERAREAVIACFRSLGQKPPRIIVVDGPLEVARMREGRSEKAHDNRHLEISGSIYDALANQFRAQILRCVARDAILGVAANVARSLRAMVTGWHVLRYFVQADVFRRVGRATAANLDMIDRVGPYGPFCMFTHRLEYLVLCDILLGIAGVPCPKGLAAEMALASSCGGWVPLNAASGHLLRLPAEYAIKSPEDVVVILQRPPCELHVRKDLPHWDGGPVVRYADGFAIWALNGVFVPQWLAESRSEDLDPRRLFKIHNAEVRREFVRKVGLERICAASNARCLDRMGDYELLLLDLSDGRNRPYLKMLNPSLGTWHVEGVHPACRTVPQALAWRNGSVRAPRKLT